MTASGQSYSIPNDISPVFFKQFDRGELYVIDVQNDTMTAGHLKMDGLYDWIITRKTKKIIGFDCQKTTCQDGDREGIAWFAKDIPVFDGLTKYFFATNSRFF